MWPCGRQGFPRAFSKNGGSVTRLIRGGQVGQRFAFSPSQGVLRAEVCATDARCPRSKTAGSRADLRTCGKRAMHPDDPSGDGWRRPFTPHPPPRTLLARSETTGHPTDCAPSSSVRAQCGCRSPPRQGTDRGSARSCIPGAFARRAGTPAPTGRDGADAPLVPRPFPAKLTVAVEHSVQVVGGARHNWLPWIYPESYNHGIHVVILLGSAFGGQPPPRNAVKRS